MQTKLATTNGSGVTKASTTHHTLHANNMILPFAPTAI